MRAREDGSADERERHGIFTIGGGESVFEGLEKLDMTKLYPPVRGPRVRLAVDAVALGHRDRGSDGGRRIRRRKSALEQILRARDGLSGVDRDLGAR